MAILKENGTVSDNVYHHLLCNILSGAWQPGDKIASENELAETLGVSRNSVRTAIGRLIALDVLESRRGGGTFVRQSGGAGVYLSSLMPALVLGSDSILEILEFRRILEIETARLAALRATPEELSLLEENLAAMREEPYEAADFASRDMRFHELIALSSKNSLLIRIFGLVSDVLIASQFFVQKTVGPSYTFIYHPRIIEALKSRDPEKAAREMTEHLDITMKLAKRPSRDAGQQASPLKTKQTATINQKTGGISMVSSQDLKHIEKMAAKIRRDVVLMIGGTGHVGHLGGSCSSADIVSTLYFHKMKLDPNNPKWEGRDKFLFSKGHACIAQYAALAETGYFSTDILPSLKSMGSILQGHPDVNKTPGIEANTGSLGQGLSIANGMALAMRLDKKDNKVYCILGDGELAEGQIWEAAMAAANFKIDNVVAIVDRNGLQATGACSERFCIPDINGKWASFGWHVIEIDGHDIEQIVDALNEADSVKGRPTVIIANTVKGKGISFAENVVGFHNGAMTAEQYEQALAELDKRIGSLS